MCIFLKSQGRDNVTVTFKCISPPCVIFNIKTRSSKFIRITAIIAINFFSKICATTRHNDFKIITKQLLISFNTYNYDTECVGSLMPNLSFMIDVEASECEVLEDYEREMNVVRQLEGGSKGVNTLVTGVVVGTSPTNLRNASEESVANTYCNI